MNELLDLIKDYGGYAGAASVLGLAVLSLLYFAQAREVKRLREWAGRAPERAAELEQRAVEAARRPVPQRAAAVRPGQPQTAAAQQRAATATPNGQAGVPGAPGAVPAAAAGAAAGAAASPGQPTTQQPTPAPGQPATPGAPGQPATPGTPGTPAAGAAPAPAPAGSGTPTPPSAGTAAAAGAAAGAAGAAAGGVGGPPPRTPAGRPGGSRPQASPRVPAQAARAGQASATLGPRSDHAVEKRNRLPIFLGAGALGLVLIVVLVLVLGGGGDDPGTGAGARTEPESTLTPPPNAETQPGTTTQPVERSEVTVAVLNGTTIDGLAGRVSERIQGAGFTKGTVATGATQDRSATLIEYGEGQRNAAREVAREIGVDPNEALDPLTQSTRTLAGEGADVVVTVGSDYSDAGAGDAAGGTGQ